MVAQRLPRRGGPPRPVVVDASVAVQWFANEPGSDAAARLLDGNHLLLAPDSMAIEAANAWWRKVKAGDMTATDLEQAIVNLFATGLALIPTAPMLVAAARLARDIRHPVYDCVYLIAARRQGALLATADVRLHRAADRIGLRLWASR
ncbi:MAG: type II toxin-antitoxin system VapC family toxin [Pseudomonadota bacterium]